MFVQENITRKYYDAETDEHFSLVWKYVICQAKTSAKEIITTMVMPRDSKVWRIPIEGFHYVVAGWWGR
jgi:hypothetical protein